MTDELTRPGFNIGPVLSISIFHFRLTTFRPVQVMLLTFPRRPTLISTS